MRPAVYLSEAEAEAYILQLLRSRGSMTTMQIEEHAREDAKRCPDHTVRFLSKMKMKGLIKGEVSIECRGWLWSLP